MNLRHRHRHAAGDAGDTEQYRQRIGREVQIDPRRRRIGVIARRAAAHQPAEHQQQQHHQRPAGNGDGEMGGAPAVFLRAPVDQRRPECAADVISAGDDRHRKAAIAFEPVRGFRHQGRERGRRAEPHQEGDGDELPQRGREPRQHIGARQQDDAAGHRAEPSRYRIQGTPAFLRSGRGQFGPQGPQLGYSAAMPALPSVSLTQSPIHQGSKKIPSREALILAILINHPNLLALHSEEIGALELATRDTTRLRDTLLILASEGAASHSEIVIGIDKAELADIRRRVEQSANSSLIGLRIQPNAPISDVAERLAGAMALHRKEHQLNKAIIAAAATVLADWAVVADWSETNFDHLFDLVVERSRNLSNEASRIESGRMAA